MFGNIPTFTQVKYGTLNGINDLTQVHWTSPPSNTLAQYFSDLAMVEEFSFYSGTCLEGYLYAKIEGVGDLSQLR